MAGGGDGWNNDADGGDAGEEDAEGWDDLEAFEEPAQAPPPPKIQVRLWERVMWVLDAGSGSWAESCRSAAHRGSARRGSNFSVESWDLAKSSIPFALLELELRA